MRLSEIAIALELELEQDCPKDNNILGVCIDSREVKPGYLFVAICGKQFDGHDFIREAVAKGACAVVSSRHIPDVHVPQFIVANTIDALAKMATLHRASLSCDIIALTGSNGKTTVKEMIGAILPKPSYATKGNLNNHIGAPLCLLQVMPEHRMAVFELGASHPGEIAYTVGIVQPQVTLINNIAPAHIEGFGSIEGVARAKGEIHQGLIPGGTAVINEDDAYAHFWDDILVNKKVIRFSKEKSMDVFARNIQFDDKGCAQFILNTSEAAMSVSLQVPGQHQISNALAAAACATALGLSLADIVAGLTSFRGVAGRMTFLLGKNKATIIDDTYNANLRSVLAALAVLKERKGKRIVVLGDLGELGEWTTEHHQQIGVAARDQNIDLLLTCGEHSASASSAFGQESKHYSTQEALVNDLLPQLNAETTVLIKGSRSAKMERIVQQLVDATTPY